MYYRIKLRFKGQAKEPKYKGSPSLLRRIDKASMTSTKGTDILHVKGAENKEMKWR